MFGVTIMVPLLLTLYGLWPPSGAILKSGNT